MCTPTFGLPGKAGHQKPDGQTPQVVSYMIHCHTLWLFRGISAQYIDVEEWVKKNGDIEKHNSFSTVYWISIIFIPTFSIFSSLN